MYPFTTTGFQTLFHLTTGKPGLSKQPVVTARRPGSLSGRGGASCESNKLGLSVSARELRPCGLVVFLMCNPLSSFFSSKAICTHSFVVLHGHGCAHGVERGAPSHAAAKSTSRSHGWFRIQDPCPGATQARLALVQGMGIRIALALQTTSVESSSFSFVVLVFAMYMSC